MTTELATIPKLAVIDTETGERYDLADLTVEQSALLYPFLQRFAAKARRDIEMSMEQRGASEWLGSGFAYSYQGETEWTVDAVALRNVLLSLTFDPNSGITKDEVEEAIQIVVTGKANKTKVNALKKRSAIVREAIDAAYSATTTLPRLRVKEK